MMIESDMIASATLLMAAISFVYGSLGANSRRALTRNHHLANEIPKDIPEAAKREMVHAQRYSALPCFIFMLTSVVMLFPLTSEVILSSLSLFVAGEGMYDASKSIYLLFFLVLLYFLWASGADLFSIIKLRAKWND